MHTAQASPPILDSCVCSQTEGAQTSAVEGMQALEVENRYRHVQGWAREAGSTEHQCVSTRPSQSRGRRAAAAKTWVPRVALQIRHGVEQVNTTALRPRIPLLQRRPCSPVVAPASLEGSTQLQGMGAQ